KDLKISEDQIDKLLNVIPLASHNQRAKGQIIVGGGNGQQELVDVLKKYNYGGPIILEVKSISGLQRAKVFMNSLGIF
ncbi:MAG: hypothetical protein ACTSSP_12185, partial [Candidatus Asgardarchaeia archaeon]